MGAVTEHPLTSSYKNSFLSGRFRHWQQRMLEAGNYDAALELGIRDIRRVARRLGNDKMFDLHIQQMLDSLPKSSDGKIDWSLLQRKP